MKTCQSCKNDKVPDFSLYCGKCGQPDTLAIAKLNVCQYCDNTLSIEDITCPSCGAVRRKIEPIYPKNTKLRKCESCGMLIPRDDKYCLNCGSTIHDNEPQVKKLNKRLKIITIISIVTVVLFCIILPIGEVIYDKIEHNRWQKEFETSQYEVYQQGLTAEYIEYTIEEILQDMKDENFGINYKAKYYHQYICLTAQLYDIGVYGTRTEIIPIDGKYNLDRKIWINFYDRDYSEEFTETYIKGDIIKIYGYVEYMYDGSCGLTTYRVERA